METTQTAPAKSYGFIGLGVMGWGMATNLRAKIPEDAALYVCEIDKARLDSWIAEASGPIYVAENPAEIVKKCVS
jgi:3-hydroxyisobutyrate dehydrogenase